LSFAPLRLVRDDPPSIRWSEVHFSVLSGGLLVGRISNDAHWVRAGAQQWHRTISGVHAGPVVMQIHGIAARPLEEAQQALAENWRRWLAWPRLGAGW
jgi:hypothetical protein